MAGASLVLDDLESFGDEKPDHPGKNAQALGGALGNKPFDKRADLQKGTGKL